MKNAHVRFGWFTYYKRTEKTTTTFKIRLDRFIGEASPDNPRSGKAHLVSVIGGDTQIAAINTALSMNEAFEIEGPGIARFHVSLGRNAQVNKASLQLPDRKKPLRHLLGISEELAANTGASGRTILAASSSQFIWTSLAQIHGLPGIPEWADWFCHQLEEHKAIVPLLGIGCNPALVKGNKKEFLDWLSRGVRSEALQFPRTTGRIEWPSLGLTEILGTPSEQAHIANRYS